MWSLLGTTVLRTLSELHFAYKRCAGQQSPSDSICFVSPSRLGVAPVYGRLCLLRKKQNQKMAKFAFSTWFTKNDAIKQLRHLVNCHGIGGGWQLDMYEEYHKDFSWYLTLDCDVVGEALAAIEFELKYPRKPERFQNSSAYCRYSNMMHKNTVGTGGGAVTTLLDGMPREEIMRTVNKLGETTYGCSAHNYRYTAFGEHTHVKLICLYRKRYAQPTCI